MQKRPSWTETWMNQAINMSQRSTCAKYKIGAIYVAGNNKEYLVSGYNGPPIDEPHCIEVGCAKLDKDGKLLPSNSGKCRGCHAERNGITNSSKRGIILKNSIVYCTSSPCRECAKDLINLEIIKFIFKEKYKEDFEEVQEIFHRHNINLIEYKEK